MMASKANPNDGGDGDHWVNNEISPRRVRVALNGEIVADSKRALLMREAWHQPVYYFPPEDIRMDLMERTDNLTH